MRLLYWVVAVALMSTACSSLRVRCDSRLRPINIAPPASDSVGRGDVPAAEVSTRAGRNLSGAKP